MPLKNISDSLLLIIFHMPWHWKSWYTLLYNYAAAWDGALNHISIIALIVLRLEYFRSVGAVKAYTVFLLLYCINWVPWCTFFLFSCKMKVALRVRRQGCLILLFAYCNILGIFNNMLAQNTWPARLGSQFLISPHSLLCWPSRCGVAWWMDGTTRSSYL